MEVGTKPERVEVVRPQMEDDGNDGTDSEIQRSSMTKRRVGKVGTEGGGGNDGDASTCIPSIDTNS